MGNATKAKAFEGFILKLSNKIFQQMLGGEYNFEKDLKQLENYRMQVQKVNGVDAEARIVTYIAALYSFSGQTRKAIDIFHESYDLYAQEDNKPFMASTLGNTAATLITCEDYDTAIEYCDRGLALIAPEDAFGKYRFLLFLKMKIAYLQANWDEVDALYQRINDLIDKFDNEKKLFYARFMCTVYRIKAEREIIQSEYVEAKSNINLATEFAQGLSLTFELAEIYCTHAHLAMATDNDIESAEQYWQQALDTASTSNSPSYIGHFYLEEARYLQRNGYPEKAYFFAELAKTMFIDNNMSEELQNLQNIFPQI